MHTPVGAAPGRFFARAAKTSVLVKSGEPAQYLPAGHAVHWDGRLSPVLGL